MYRYGAILLAIVAIGLFLSQPISYSSWLSLLIVIIGGSLGILSVKRGERPTGLIMNGAILSLFIISLFVRIFTGLE